MLCLVNRLMSPCKISVIELFLRSPIGEGLRIQFLTVPSKLYMNPVQGTGQKFLLVKYSFESTHILHMHSHLHFDIEGALALAVLLCYLA